MRFRVTGIIILRETRGNVTRLGDTFRCFGSDEKAITRLPYQMEPNGRLSIGSARIKIKRSFARRSIGVWEQPLASDIRDISSLYEYRVIRSG